MKRSILIISILLSCLTTGIFAQTPITLCPQSASFTGMTRGYYFTAPTNFTICGVYVEDNMSTAFQSAAIVRFTAGPPPAYSATTNSFVTLWQNLNYAPNNMIPVPNVAINAGDIIGIYGSRTSNSVNSYGPANCVINIQGFPTTTYRSGMQFDLAAGPGMHDIWNENSGSIGRVTMYTGCCPAPAAISGITGPTSVCEGDVVTYSVPSQPLASAYNWTVPAGATINSGQNTTSINVTWNTAPGGQVCVDWTDTCTTSAPTCINVTVNPPPTVTVPANASYCDGDPVPASAFVSNPAGGTFTWTNSDPSIGLAASGTGNTPAFTATNGTGSPITATITVTPVVNFCTGTPSNYTITVNPIPAAPTASSVTICPNNSTTLTATAPGGTYEWYDAPTGGTLLSTGAIYTTPVLVANTTYYVQTTLNGCTSVRTPVTVNIAPALVINAGPDDTICSGGSYNLLVTPNGAGYSYLWDEPGNPGFSNLFNPTVSPTATTTYTVTVTDPSNCVGSDNVTITVNPSPTMTAPANGTYCDGDAVPASAFASNPAGGTFDWINTDPTIGLAASGTGNTPAFTATNTTGAPITATITVTPTVNGCVGTPVNYTITVNPTPTVTVPANASYCDGDPVPVGNFVGTPTGVSYAWTNSNTAIGLGASGAGSPPSFTATNTTGGSITGTITVTPTANGCTGTPVNYTITVNSMPTVTVPANATYCDGDVVPVSNFVNNPAGGTFDWTNTDPTIGLGGSGTGNTPTFTATNTTGAAVTATITVTPTNGCTGVPSSYTITVNPGATAIVPGNVQVCPGDPVPASAFTSNPAGGTFDWTNSNTTIGLGSSGTGNTPVFNATNTSGTPQVATITVTATANGCTGASSTYDIIVNPIVTGSTNVSVCQGDSMLINGTYYSVAGSYLDTITSSYGCDSVLTYNLTINPVSTSSMNVVTCDSAFIEGNYYSVAGSYPFTFNNYLGCDSTITYNLSISPIHSFGITGGGLINLGEEMNLAVMPGVFGTTYSWDPPFGLSCLYCQDPVASPMESTWYYVTVTNAAGCIGVDSVYIEVDPSTNIYVPNIFSPNEDGNNDVYLVRGKGIEQFSLMIFNRWGQKVFESDDIEKGWDGTKGGSPLNQGVFVYKLNVRMYDGDTYQQTGNITLVR